MRFAGLAHIARGPFALRGAAICRALRRDRASSARPYVHPRASDHRKRLRTAAFGLSDAAVCCEMRNHVGAGIASPLGCMMLREYGTRIVKSPACLPARLRYVAASAATGRAVLAPTCTCGHRRVAEGALHLRDAMER